MEKTTPLTVADWAPAPIAWKAFCTENPGLGLAGTRASWSWLNRNYGQALIAAGVMRKSVGRTKLINTKTFAHVAFEMLTTQPTQTN